MNHKERSLQIRRLIMDGFKGGGRGHVSSAFSMVEILCALYDHVMKFDPKNPKWIERDRCLLSKGHGCLALYAILAIHGFFSKDELNTFCHAKGMLGGHPQYGKVPGIEASTGSLGHGLSIAVGQALCMKKDSPASRIFTIMGDGECGEGSVWEAAMCAGKHKLDNLIAIVDYNKLQSYGTVADILPLEPFADKWQACGFAVKEVDGHNSEELEKVLSSTPFTSGKPSAVICHTIKGKGIPSIEGDLSWHHKARLKIEDHTLLLKELEDNA